MASLDTSLTGFIAEVKNGGLAKSSKYTVMISKPIALNQTGFAFNADLNKYILFCDGASLPSTTMASGDTSVFGETRESPTQRSYGELNLSFYVDIDLQIKLFFDSWMNTIINPVSRTHGYYNDYIANIEIIVYGFKDDPRYKMTLFECYPKHIGEIALGYDVQTLMKLPVGIQYKYYTVFDYKGGSAIEHSAISNANSYTNITSSNVQGQLLNGKYYDTNPVTTQDANGVFHIGKEG